MKLLRHTRHVVGLVAFSLVSYFPAQAEYPAVAPVPATDPAATNVPAMLPAAMNVHPRLLYTDDQIKALKDQASSDPVMQKAYSDCKTWCANFKPPTGTPSILVNESEAIWWSMGYYPALAYIYSMDHDPEVKQKIIDTLTLMLNSPYWSKAGPAEKETDNSMGAACNMAMVGILYDAVYNDLDPDLREKLAQKMFLHCRRMYWLGHKELSLAIHYWQNDPQPNHRWYRDAGLAACMLAIADDKNIDSGYILQGLKEEMDFVMKWYPPDGDCHEGAGYQAFGYVPISIAARMMDNVMGTTYLQTSGIKNAAAQQIYYYVPGRLSDISYGDDVNGPGGNFTANDASFFFGPHLTRDKNMQAALVQRMNTAMHPAKNGTPFAYQWTMLANYDASVGSDGDYKALPLARLFPDMGSATMRDSWEKDAVVFTFKCGPYGGYKLSEYRNETPENGKPHYINIAHDDPDANEFAMSLGDGFVFHPGVYSLDLKVTRDHNTIIVDDKGQVGEGDGFTQPPGDLDQTKLSYLTGWKTDEKGHVIIEGEAGAAYRGIEAKELKAAGGVAPDPVLSKFRRTAIWLPGEYVLVLDDIASASGAHNISWHAVSPTATTDGKGKNTATTETGGTVDFQTVSNKDFTTTVAPNYLLAGRFASATVQQFQQNINTDAVKFATVIDPWKKGAEVKMTEANGIATVTVHSSAGDDTWTWQSAADNSTPSLIDGKRGGRPLISLTAADKAPTK